MTLDNGNHDKAKVIHILQDTKQNSTRDTPNLLDARTNSNMEYHVRLLNASRSLFEAAIDAYIRSKFAGKYVTWQEPTTEIVSLLPDTWKYSSSCRNVRVSWLKKIHQLERL
ncbi:hypothetical protein CCR75_007018 [Bremia lactucae]|uniref:Uncharacterized protein n=1 Tax=Bremia lactucae TaxID=4779 RepID=A0A976ICC9_BRELC|nr:hypothetical protein CCR75_007018 [Bremia lactucae]